MNEPAYDAALDHVLDWRSPGASIASVDVPDGESGPLVVALTVGRRKGSCSIACDASADQVKVQLDALADSLGSRAVKATR